MIVFGVFDFAKKLGNSPKVRVVGLSVGDNVLKTQPRESILDMEITRALLCILFLLGRRQLGTAACGSA